MYSNGQGFAWTKGFGALIDAKGDDSYYANPGDPTKGGDPLYFTPQMPGRGNSSFTQGAGFGRRDDTGGTSMSGGIGLLADFAGKDQYTASVFAQGAGYWFGTGVLYDADGDDVYDGHWYVRGAAAHFALSLFHDLNGNDKHNTNFAGVNTSFGVGHDHSIAFLVDDAGNDEYHAPNLALGSGNACGWGFFLDGGGDDVYDAHGVSYGRFGDPLDCSWNLQPTIGVLVDAGGKDTYSQDGAPIARDGKTTLQDQDAHTPDSRGVHLDASGGSVLVLP
jgi:hypothetical protein